ncbi:MAG: hypothetical protein GEU90_22455 [Gemmatimonas sp.]|nr:hypothetical protein [Gemmatimonas sp.]
MTTIRMELGAQALSGLHRPVVGEGGFQFFLRKLQKQVVDGNTLILTGEDIERLARHVHDYGQGGFQGRLDAVLRELSGLARVLAPLAA